MNIGAWSLLIKKETETSTGNESEADRSDLPNDVTISKERELLFRQAQNDQHALWMTYNRYYTGARYVGYLSWATTATTAIIGAILLALISGNSGWWVFTESVVTVFLVAVSLLSAFYKPQARSVKYYRSGQDFQELYDEYENFVNLKVPDLSRDIGELNEEFRELHRRRHLVNQGAPQLSGIWYQLLNWLLDDGLLSTVVGYLSAVKIWVVKLLSSTKDWISNRNPFWSNEDNGADDGSEDNEAQRRYKPKCGTDKPQWEETLCEKIVNHGHPPGHSEGS